MAPSKTKYVGKVERFGTSIVLPEKPPMSYDVAIDILKQQRDFEETIVKHQAGFNYNPYDVAFAFSKALDRVCGAVVGKPIQTFFGEIPPKQLSIEVGPGEFRSINWGRLVFPFEPSNNDAFFDVGVEETPDGFRGRVFGQFRQKYKAIWDELLKETNAELLQGSLFRGRTMRVTFTDKSGNPLPLPNIRPWDVRNASNTKLVFPRAIERVIENNIFAPIQYMAACNAVGVPFKRGVLLAGDYGTGKTELAAKVASMASTLNMTVIYLDDVKELPLAVRFIAQIGGPGIIFGEDIDRITNHERDADIDKLLNTLDGIDTKKFAIMTIVTSNYPETIYPGMLRSGRLNVALKIPRPDAEAAVRLVQNYLGELLAPETQPGELDALGASLAGGSYGGMIPADIREVCERSKLGHIYRTKGQVPGPQSILVEDVLSESIGMRGQIELREGKRKAELTAGDHLVEGLSKLIGMPLRAETEGQIENTHELVEAINRRF